MAQLPTNEGFHGLLLDDSGQLYGGMVRSARLYKIHSDGSYEAFARLPGQVGNLLWFRGYIFATDFQSNQLFRISLAGNVELFAGSGSRGSADGKAAQAQFFHPNGLVASSDGSTLYLSESGGSVRALTIVELDQAVDAGDAG